MPAALHIQQLNKHFANGKHALRDINLTVQPGEMVALIGASGSGKSTLLRHVAGLAVADASSESLIEVDGRCVQRAGRIHSDIRRTRSQVGFVFQQFNLVDRLPVMMNVLVGLLHRTPWWRAWLRMFKPHERALALEARTLVQGAKVVLADEPIASLDPESSRKVMEILARINREDGSTVIVSLHQVDMAVRYCPRVVALHQGQVVYDGPSAALTPALLRSLYGVHADEILADAVTAAPAAHPMAPVATNPAQVPQWAPAMAQAA